MKIDIASTLGAVVREVRSGERDGRPVRTVVAARTYDTTVDDLWEALTSAERLPRWFLPISGELREGGRYQLQGNAGGTITRCEAPRLLSVTWELGKQTSWLDVSLTAGPRGALLELRHTVPIDAHWEQFGPGAVGVGWDLTLMGLGLHIATGAPNDPQEFAAWSASDEGKDLARRASEDWRRADVAGGADPAAAASAAARTAAAYTGAG